MSHQPARLLRARWCHFKKAGCQKLTDSLLIFVPDEILHEIVSSSLLNAYFDSGSVPACVTSALVTPIHKKGCDLDTKKRPIAVGEPLYRLYTVILNKRLVD